MNDHWTQVFNEVNGSPTDLRSNVLGIDVDCWVLREVEAIFLQCQVILQSDLLWLLTICGFIIWNVRELDSVWIGDVVLLSVSLYDRRETGAGSGVTIDLLKLGGDRVDDNVDHCECCGCVSVLSEIFLSLSLSLEVMKRSLYSIPYTLYPIQHSGEVEWKVESARRVPQLSELSELTHKASANQKCRV